MSEIEEAEKAKMRAKCQKIVDHGINCFINRQLIYNFPEQVGRWPGERRQHSFVCVGGWVVCLWVNGCCGCLLCVGFFGSYIMNRFGV